MDCTLLANLPTDYLIDAKLLTFVEASSSMALGIRWSAQLGLFHFNVYDLPKSLNTEKEKHYQLLQNCLTLSGG